MRYRVDEDFEACWAPSSCGDPALARCATCTTTSGAAGRSSFRKITASSRPHGNFAVTDARTCATIAIRRSFAAWKTRRTCAMCSGLW